MIDFVIDNFDIDKGETQTKIAIVCTSRSSKSTVIFRNISQILKSPICQSKPNHRKENLDYNLNVTAYFLRGKKARKDLEKSLLVRHKIFILTQIFVIKFLSQCLRMAHSLKTSRFFQRILKWFANMANCSFSISSNRTN